MPTPPEDSADLTGLTTPIEVQFTDGRQEQGSGFFYFEFAPEVEKKEGPHWSTVTHMYVVTAKHVIQPERLDRIVTFSYAVRIGEGDHVAWHQLHLNKHELESRLHICKDKKIDVAVVDVSDQLTPEIKALLTQRAQVLGFRGTDSTQFPSNNKDLEIQPGDDVVVIGYPLGIYDVFNKLPILKTGLLNTPLGMHFNGMDAFLIDYKYYEGSSGSLIISKPTHFGLRNGTLMSSVSRQYLFLGVYEGESYWNDVKPLSADLGLGWYYYNVEEAVKNSPFVH
jgi:hypothetical protein